MMLLKRMGIIQIKVLDEKIEDAEKITDLKGCFNKEFIKG